MTYESNTGLGVNNHYGARETGGVVGSEHTQNSLMRVTINLTGEMLNGTFLPPVYLPKGALLKNATLNVIEAFSLSGTTPAVTIGSYATIASNYISLSKTELEATGSKVPSSTGAGTWSTSSSTGLGAKDKVGFAITGTSPVVSKTAGKANLVLEFFIKSMN